MFIYIGLFPYFSSNAFRYNKFTLLYDLWQERRAQDSECTYVHVHWANTE